jgi:hypothetical protein
MRMELLLFADENAPEWAFSKRKGVKNQPFRIQIEYHPNSFLLVVLLVHIRKGLLVAEAEVVGAEAAEAGCAL